MHKKIITILLLTLSFSLIANEEQEKKQPIFFHCLAIEAEDFAALGLGVKAGPHTFALMRDEGLIGERLFSDREESYSTLLSIKTLKEMLNRENISQERCIQKMLEGNTATFTLLGCEVKLTPIIKDGNVEVCLSLSKDGLAMPGDTLTIPDEHFFMTCLSGGEKDFILILQPLIRSKLIFHGDF